MIYSIFIFKKDEMKGRREEDSIYVCVSLNE